MRGTAVYVESAKDFIYFVAAEDDGDISDSEPMPVLSARHINATTKNSTRPAFVYHGPPEASAVIRIHSTQRSQEWITPIMLEIVDNSVSHYGYLITLRQGQKDAKYPTYIGRFCVGDATLRSCTELPLRCRGNVKEYYKAVSASISNGTWITVTLTNSRRESAICVFSISEINAAFDKQIEQCYRGKTLEENTEIIWITGQKIRCKLVGNTKLPAKSMNATVK